MLLARHLADLVHVQLTCDHRVPERYHHDGHPLQTFSSLVRDQDAKVLRFASVINFSSLTAAIGSLDSVIGSTPALLERDGGRQHLEQLGYVAWVYGCPAKRATRPTQTTRRARRKWLEWADASLDSLRQPQTKAGRSFSGGSSRSSRSSSWRQRMPRRVSSKATTRKIASDEWDAQRLDGDGGAGRLRGPDADAS
jgi:hypothetical protein